VSVAKANKKKENQQIKKNRLVVESYLKELEGGWGGEE